MLQLFCCLLQKENSCSSHVRGRYLSEWHAGSACTANHQSQSLLIRSQQDNRASSACCSDNLKWTYHAIFKWYIVGPYLYKVYLYVSVFKIPNRSCILAMPHFALCVVCCLRVWFCWARPPAGEVSRALISCWAVRRGGEKEISVLRVLLYRVVIHLF